MVSQTISAVFRWDTYHPTSLAAIKPNTSLNRKYSGKVVSSFNFQTHTCLEIPLMAANEMLGKTHHTQGLWVSEAITHLVEQGQIYDWHCRFQLGGINGGQKPGNRARLELGDVTLHENKEISWHLLFFLISGVEPFRSSFSCVLKQRSSYQFKMPRIQPKAPCYMR